MHLVYSSLSFSSLNFFSEIFSNTHGTSSFCVLVQETEHPEG